MLIKCMCRASFSPERILRLPPFAMKMMFLTEGPVFSATASGTRAAECNGAIYTPTCGCYGSGKLFVSTANLPYPN